MMEKEKTYFLYDGKAKMCLFTNGKNCTDKHNNCNYFNHITEFSNYSLESLNCVFIWHTKMYHNQLQ